MKKGTKESKLLLRKTTIAASDNLARSYLVGGSISKDPPLETQYKINSCGCDDDPPQLPTKTGPTTSRTLPDLI